MTDINVLSPRLADMIAAGEVVERPGSVIKELMENSIDAGARNITVEIRDGGATFIRVTDDGKGMTPDDAGAAFLRHATSKLHDESGLECISTMGFRGEALAAISAVSRIELTTRVRGENEGTRVVLEAGDILEMDAFGCPEGTTMVVRDLFFNTPARLKFMKSDRAEASACALAALRCALGHPEISCRFIRDGKEEFFSPGDGQISSCVYSLLGRDIAGTMLKCTGDKEGIRVSGFVSSPSAGRGNRAQQYFFCNGRFIKSGTLQAALEQGYKNSLLTGRYPACVIYIELSAAAVDVNVHPAKIEVKFSEEKKVFDGVYYAVLSALQGEKIAGTETPKVTAEPKKDFYQTMTAADFRGNGYAPARSAGGTSYMRPPAARRESGGGYQGRISSPPPIIVPPSAPPAAKSGEKPAGAPIYEKLCEEPRAQEFRLIGEAMDTYVLVEQGDGLLLIDKHACHERMIFDRLRAGEREIMSQGLIVPVIVKLSAADGEILEANGELLARLGFEIELFGENEYAVRAVPADMEQGDIGPAIEEICEKLRKNRDIDPAGARDEILHTVACKAAIKAGWKTAPEELLRLCRAVVSGEVKYCPHGRPVAVTLSRKELDKMFKRIV